MSEINGSSGTSTKGGHSTGKKGPVEAVALFPRLHVDAAKKNVSGPRAPPRNKMALYEQVTLASKQTPPGKNQFMLQPPVAMQGPPTRVSFVPSMNLYESHFSYSSYLMQSQPMLLYQGMQQTVSSSDGSHMRGKEWSHASSSGSPNIRPSEDVRAKPSGQQQHGGSRIPPSPGHFQAPKTQPQGLGSDKPGSRLRKEGGAATWSKCTRSGSTGLEDNSLGQANAFGGDRPHQNTSLPLMSNEELGPEKFAWWAWSQRHKPWMGVDSRAWGAGAEALKREDSGMLGGSVSENNWSQHTTRPQRMERSEIHAGDSRQLQSLPKSGGNSEDQMKREDQRDPGVHLVENAHEPEQNTTVRSVDAGCRDAKGGVDNFVHWHGARNERDEAPVNQVMVHEHSQSSWENFGESCLSKGVHGGTRTDSMKDGQGEGGSNCQSSPEDFRRVRSRVGTSVPSCGRHPLHSTPEVGHTSRMKQQADQEGQVPSSIIPSFSQYKPWSMTNNDGGRGEQSTWRDSVTDLVQRTETREESMEAKSGDEKNVTAAPSDVTPAMALDDECSGEDGQGPDAGDSQSPPQKEKLPKEEDTKIEEVVASEQIAEDQAFCFRQGKERRPGNLLAWGPEGPPLRNKRQRSPSDRDLGKVLRQATPPAMPLDESTRGPSHVNTRTINSDKSNGAGPCDAADLASRRGQQDFWLARRTILSQQKQLSSQVFDLHRLHKVQGMLMRKQAQVARETDRSVPEHIVTSQEGSGGSGGSGGGSGGGTSDPVAMSVSPAKTPLNLSQVRMQDESTWPLIRAMTCRLYRGPGAHGQVEGPQTVELSRRETDANYKAAECTPRHSAQAVVPDGTAKEEGNSSQRSMLGGEEGGGGGAVAEGEGGSDGASVLMEVDVEKRIKDGGKNEARRDTRKVAFAQGSWEGEKPGGGDGSSSGQRRGEGGGGPPPLRMRTAPPGGGFASPRDGTGQGVVPCGFPVPGTGMQWSGYSPMLGGLPSPAMTQWMLQMQMYQNAAAAAPYMYNPYGLYHGAGAPFAGVGFMSPYPGMYQAAPGMIQMQMRPPSGAGPGPAVPPAPPPPAPPTTTERRVPRMAGQSVHGTSCYSGVTALNSSCAMISPTSRGVGSSGGEWIESVTDAQGRQLKGVMGREEAQHSLSNDPLNGGVGGHGGGELEDGQGRREWVVGHGSHGMAGRGVHPPLKTRERESGREAAERRGQEKDKGIEGTGGNGEYVNWPAFRGGEEEKAPMRSPTSQDERRGVRKGGGELAVAAQRVAKGWRGEWKVTRRRSEHACGDDMSDHEIDLEDWNINPRARWGDDLTDRFRMRRVRSPGERPRAVRNSPERGFRCFTDTQGERVELLRAVERDQCEERERAHHKELPEESQEIQPKEEQEQLRASHDTLRQTTMQMSEGKVDDSSRHVPKSMPQSLIAWGDEAEGSSSRPQGDNGVIKVVPRPMRATPDSTAVILRSLQEQRKKADVQQKDSD